MKADKRNRPAEPSVEEQEGESTSNEVASESKTNPRGKPKREHLWKKGQSGNPGGRPRGLSEVRELARTYGPSAIRRLARLMRSKNERVAVAACQALLDRGFGKANQPIASGSPLVAINVAAGSPGQQLSPDQAYRLIAADVHADIEGITSRLLAPAALHVERDA